ncbi:hypothetical protein YB2330_001632 [Saitoella coloradoensis]
METTRNQTTKATLGKRQRSVSDLGQTEKRRWACDFEGCTKSFQRRDHLERHQANHAPIAPFACGSCGRNFARLDVLEKHLKIHERDREKQQQAHSAPGPPPAQPIYRNIDLQAYSLPPLGISEGPPPSRRFSELDTPQHQFLSLQTPAHVSPLTFASPTGGQATSSPLQTFSQQSSQDELSLCASGDFSFFNDVPADNYSWLFDLDQMVPPNPDPPSYTYPSVDLSTAQNQTTPTTQFALPQVQTPSSRPRTSQTPLPPLQLDHPPLHSLSPELIECEAGFLTANCRTRILKFIPADFSTCPKLSLSALQTYMELFWLHFYQQSPIIHRPSFYPPTTPEPLLIIMLAIGASHSSDRGAWEIMKGIVTKLRTRLWEMTEESPALELWVLQTMLLVSYYEKMMGDSVQHDMGQIFHGSTVAFVRFAGLFRGEEYASLRSNTKVSEDEQGEYRAWRRWVEYEEKKRAAYFAFLSDCQHAAMFRHTLALSAFELRMDLPCNESIWRAPNAKAWRVQYAKSSPPKAFLPTLKSLIIDPTPEGALPINNPFTNWVLLHGLLNVSWDIMWRGLYDVGIVTDVKMFDWKRGLIRALEGSNALYQTAKANKPREKYLYEWAHYPIYRLAFIALNVDLVLVRIWAGAPRVLGRPVLRGERERAGAFMRKWATAVEGRNAVYHATLLLKEIYASESWNKAVHVPWCLYLATLTCWAFGAAFEGRDPQPRRFASEEGWVEPSLARRDMEVYLNAMSVAHPDAVASVALKNQTVGIIAMAVHVLQDVKWGIVTGAHNVLKGLLLRYTDHDRSG